MLGLPASQCLIDGYYRYDVDRVNQAPFKILLKFVGTRITDFGTRYAFEIVLSPHDQSQEDRVVILRKYDWLHEITDMEVVAMAAS